MKLDAAHLKTLLRNKDTWVVVGGIAAAVTAIAVVSGRGGSSVNSDGAYAYPNDGLPGGGDSTGDTADPSMSLVAAQDHFSEFAAWSAPEPVDRAGSSSVPVVGLPPAPAAPTMYADRAGNSVTLDQLMAQQFTTSVASAPEAEPATRTFTREIAAPSPAAAPDAPVLYGDRWGNMVTLDELLNQGPLSNSDARQAPVATATGSAYSVPAPAPLYVEPIIAGNLKTPGGGLAYPGGGVETYMGGGGSPLTDNSAAALAP